MRRRDFFGLTVGSFAFVSPRLTLAQQSGKLPIIGFLGGATPTMWAAWSGAFVDCLKALGWIDGQTAKLEFRWAEGRPELYAQFAQEFAAKCKCCRYVWSSRSGTDEGDIDYSHCFRSSK